MMSSVSSESHHPPPQSTLNNFLRSTDQLSSKAEAPPGDPGGTEAGWDGTWAGVSRPSGEAVLGLELIPARLWGGLVPQAVQWGGGGLVSPEPCTQHPAPGSKCPLTRSLCVGRPP